MNLENLKNYFERIFGKAILIAVPYGWHIVFFFIPLLIVFGLSFSDSIVGAPPFASIISWVDESFLQIRLNLWNYQLLKEDSLYLSGYVESLRIAGLATFFCLLIGYPIAYGISRVNAKTRIILLLLVILPFWTSFLIRVYAWIGLLNYHGIINNFLLDLKIISQPLPLNNNKFSVCLGIVYSYLPFMILPLYSALEKIDYQILEAAYDLGCKPARAFWTITVPLSMKGIIAGSMLVFIPAVGEFVIPELLGGPDTIMIGKILWTEFFTNRDWPVAAALAMAMLILLVLPIIGFQKFTMQPQEKE
ncbi:MAG: putrescine ABC transporter permease PotH [Caedibacter sp. 37-49]|nr:MAG: putrescine ABC transporter permease PotH [Caedibacter sp. 37-49]